MKIKHFILSASLVTLGCLAPKAAIAHAIETNFQEQLDNLELQTTFSSGEAFPDAPVTIYSPDNPYQPAYVGRTDKDGKFNFHPDPSKTGNWKVEIGRADDAHWDRIIVPVSKEGINVQEISELPPQPEHHHDYIAYSFLLTIIGLGVIFGTRRVNNQLDV